MYSIGILSREQPHVKFPPLLHLLQSNIFHLALLSALAPQPLLMPENSDELKSETNLPLRKLELHLSTTLGGQTGLLLEGPPHDSGSDSQVLVVAVVFPLADRSRTAKACAQT